MIILVIIIIVVEVGSIVIIIVVRISNNYNNHLFCTFHDNNVVHIQLSTGNKKKKCIETNKNYN